MDRIKNPFFPGAGSPPPELVGRDALLEESLVLLARTQQMRPEKSMLLTGLRGVGKTVLLNEMERQARANAYHTISIEAHENKRLAPLIAPSLRSLLYELSQLEGISNKVKRGLRVLRSFLSGLKIGYGDITLGIDIEPEPGSADSGDLEIDLPSLFVAVAEAAQEKKTAVAIFIDEIQYFSEVELGALIMAMHRIQQRRLPLVLMGAGLPVLPGLAGDSKSYAERLFHFPDVGALVARDAKKALCLPVQAVGVTFTDDAVKEIFQMTKGYPYFLQEWGYQSWNSAESTPITLPVIKRATQVVIARLDQNFFRVRFNRLTPSEQNFLRAMAELGPGPHHSGDIANVLNVKLSHLSQIRAKLIAKGMIYSPVHGDIAFTVPLFDEFMKRAMPHLESCFASVSRKQIYKTSE